MTLVGKINAHMEIKSEAERFHKVFSSRPQVVISICPETILSCVLKEGNWGKVGSVICWSYILDGKPWFATELIEAIDDENYSTTYAVIGGDFLKTYKSFKIIIQITRKEEEEGSLVHWSIEYEKLNEDVPVPYTKLEFAVSISKEIDDYLLKEAYFPNKLNS